MAGGSTGERPFGDIITSIRYWVIHSITYEFLVVGNLLARSKNGAFAA